jgi:vesicle-associated membrane protein 7
MQRILEKIPPTDGRMSYVFENHYFHYLVDDGITYLCMAEEAFGRRIPFAFLDDLKNRFKATYGNRGKTALSFAMQADFSRVMQNLMEYYSNAANADKITKLKGQMEEVKSIMITNIEKVLERGEKIELLVEKTDQLNQTAVQFKKKSTGLKQAMWWKNFKLTLLIILIALFIVYIIVAVACRGIIFQGCWSSSSPTPPPPQPSPTPA